MKKSEEEFVKEVFSEEELASMESGTPDEGGSQDDVEAGKVSTSEDVVEQQPEPKMVDVRAVQEARAAERALREEVARLKTEKAAETARLEERINMINQAMAAANQKEQVPQAPSRDEDILGFYDHKFETLEQQLKAQQEAEKQRAEAWAMEERRRASINEADAVIGAAIQQDPAVQEAMNFALEGIKNDIVAEMDRRNIPAPQRGQVYQQWLDQTIVDMAAKCPRDPGLAAEFVRRHARYYGYGYQQPQAVQQTQQAAPAKPTIQQRAEQQERHMSLSGAQGGTAPPKLDAKALASMSDEQYRELLKTVAGRKQLEEIFGGV